MGEALKFAVTPVQRCVANIDGSMQQNHKNVYCLKSIKHDLTFIFFFILHEFYILLILVVL